MTARKRAGARRAREATVTRAPESAPRLLLLSLALGFALRAIASLLPIPAVWGLDTLRILPTWQAIAILLLGATGFVPAVARGIERALDMAGLPSGRAGLVMDAVAGAAVGFALYHLHDSVRWTGDYNTRMSQLVLDAPVSKVFPQAAPLDRWINIMIPRALMGSGLDVDTALHLVGAAVGALFTVAALSFLRAAGAARGTLVASGALVLGGGYMLHFAGYDKFGPLLVGVALASCGAVRLAREGRFAWAVGAGLVVCLLSHRSGFLLVPAAAWALAQGVRRAADRGARVEAAAAGLAVLVTAGVMLPRALHLLDTVDRAQNLMRPAVTAGAPLARALGEAATRSADALNLLFLLVPLWLAGLGAAWLMRARGAAPGSAAGAPQGAERGTEPGRAAPPGAAPANGTPRFALGPVALLAIAPEVALLLVARGAQGVARDWDMYVGAALVIALASAAALLEVWRRLGAAGSLAPVLTTALAFAIPLWAMHASEPLQLSRIRSLLADRTAWTDEAWARANDFLGVRALQQRRPEDAIRAFNAAIALAPNPRFFFQLGIAHRMLMRYDDAHASFEKARALDPGLADAWIGFALLAIDARDYPRVVACAESALALAPHRRDAQEIRSRALAAIEAAGR